MAFDADSQSGVPDMIPTGKAAPIASSLRPGWHTPRRTRPAMGRGINQVNIAGPAEVRVAPVTGATLFITYKKEPNEGGGESTTVVVVSPTPAATATPTASR